LQEGLLQGVLQPADALAGAVQVRLAFRQLSG
jgi:hypothetical protein